MKRVHSESLCLFFFVPESWALHLEQVHIWKGLSYFTHSALQTAWGNWSQKHLQGTLLSKAQLCAREKVREEEEEEDRDEEEEKERERREEKEREREKERRGDWGLNCVECSMARVSIVYCWADGGNTCDGEHSQPPPSQLELITSSGTNQFKCKLLAPIVFIQYPLWSFHGSLGKDSFTLWYIQTSIQQIILFFLADLSATRTEIWTQNLKESRWHRKLPNWKNLPEDKSCKNNLL